VLYFGPPVLALGQKDVKPEDIGLDLLAGEAEAQRRLVQGWLEARHILAGIRVDGGFGLDLGLGFDPKGVHSQKLCKAFSGRTSNLAGLPDSDRLVGAFSTIGLERTDLHLARVLASDLWRGVRSNTAFLGTDSELIRRLFADFYSRLKVGKAAVYQSSDPARFGQIGAVLILEPTNSGQFITEVMQYVRLGDVAQFDPKGQASKVEIDKLVADLGADDFETRESASTKIGLIGSDALPYLVKADKSDDPEVRRRAAELRKSIEDGAAQRKKELAEGLVGRQSSFDG
jgi:hypothetical protein